MIKQYTVWNSLRISKILRNNNKNILFKNNRMDQNDNPNYYFNNNPN